MAVPPKATDSPTEPTVPVNDLTSNGSDISSSPAEAALDFEDPSTYISYITHPLLAEIWDNDEDAVYDNM